LTRLAHFLIKFSGHEQFPFLHVMHEGILFFDFGEHTFPDKKDNDMIFLGFALLGLGEKSRSFRFFLSS